MRQRRPVWRRSPTWSISERWSSPISISLVYGVATLSGQRSQPHWDCRSNTTAPRKRAADERSAQNLLAGLYLVLFTPAVVAWLRSTPHADPAAPAATDDAEWVPNGLSVALRTPVFWTATLVLTVAPIVVTALLFHQVAFFEHAGLARTQVPIALMYFAAAQVGATVLGGGMIDRGRLRAALAASRAVRTPVAARPSAARADGYSA